MTRRASWLLAVLVVSGLVGGCGGAPPAAPATPAAPAPASVLPTPTGTPAQAACADYANTVSTVRGIAAALQKGPVLPAGVALFLLDARTRASAPGATDPAMAAAQTELVAAIDDLDAQGRAMLPAGGNPARDAVQLDPTRILAAVGTIERLCGGG